MSRRRSRGITLLIASLAVAGSVAGCGTGDSSNEAWTGSVTDSAGISVVANTGEGLWRTSEAWVPVEDLAISDRATPGLVFSRITDVEVDSRGRILVLDAGSREYHVFGPDGAHLLSAGAEGSGPGEFVDPFQILVLPGDSVLVPDVGTGRASVFGPDGSFVRSFSVDRLDLAARRWGVTSAGDVVARRSGTTDVLVRLGASGEAQDTLAHLESPFRPGDSESGPVVLSPVPVWSVLSAGGVAHGHSHQYRVAVSDSAGTTRLLFSRPVTPTALSESVRAIVDDGLQAVLTEQGMPETVIDQFLGQLTYWDELPVIADILAGPDGTYWVQRAAPPEAMRFQEMNMYRTDAFRGDAWDVFDAEGRYLGEVRLPLGGRLLRITDGFLYGVRLDELDVPSVVRFRLERAAR